MAFNRIMVRLAFPFARNNFEKKKALLMIRVLLISSAVIYIIETVLMVTLEIILGVPEPFAMALDGLILIILLFPINYYFIVRPLSQQIDEHYQTNLELMQANEVLERFFSISDLLVAYMDSDFRFLRVNQAYAATDERTPEAYVGKNHFDLFPNEENRAIFETVVATGKPYYAVEKPFYYAEHPERGISYWDWSLLPVKSPANTVIALILVLKNVTDRKEAQHALVDSERRFRGVFNQTFQHSALLDPEGKALLVNQTALDFAGLAQEDVRGQPLWRFPWWDTSLNSSPDTTHIEDAVRQAASGMVVRFEQRVRAADANRAVMDITLKPVYDEHGSAILLIYEARDITERYRTEEALKRSEEDNKRLYLAERNAHQFAESLRSAVLALSGSLDSDTVLQTLLDYLNRVVPYTSAHILLLEDDEHLVVHVARGEEAWAEQDRLFGKRYEICTLPVFDPLLKHREILTVPDTLLYTGVNFLPQDEQVRCWLGIPLLAGEQIVGICLLEHICPDYFNEEQIHWARALTGQAAVAIQNAWLYEQVRDGRKHLQTLSRRLVEVQEHERHYIARELHDEAGQALASLMMGFRHLESDCGNQEAVIAHSRELKQIADTVLENLHRLAIDLRPAALDHLGLVAALRQHAETIGVQNKLAVQFETVGSIDRMPGEMETSVYRIVQETLTNVVRHASATRVDILLERRDDQLVVIVEDDGVGFETHAQKEHQVGILGMYERAEMLGGSITIESSPGNGSTVILEVPWPSES